MIWIRKLEAELQSWRDTPYLDGQQCKGVGVDCIHFVFGVVDAMYGFWRLPPQEFPKDCAFHSTETAVKALKKLISLYEPNEFVKDGSMEPGDIILASLAPSSPGHALIVGTVKNQLWHVSKIGVCRTGMNLFNHYGTLRSMDKERWN